MLRTNLCMRSGLCNGSIGILKGVIFTSAFLKKHGTPENIEGNTYEGEDVECLVIDFPDYTGRLEVEANNGVVGMPVYKIDETIDLGEGEKQTIHVFKVELAYGSTIHKSQVILNTCTPLID